MVVIKTFVQVHVAPYFVYVIVSIANLLAVFKNYPSFLLSTVRAIWNITQILFSNALVHISIYCPACVYEVPSYEIEDLLWLLVRISFCLISFGCTLSDSILDLCC